MTFKLYIYFYTAHQLVYINYMICVRVWVCVCVCVCVWNRAWAQKLLRSTEEQAIMKANPFKKENIRQDR